jgi:1,4-alpha-glucan branching enzyme
MARGAIALLLHAHLPFVRHPGQEEVSEERWLHEAVTETYIPLLEMLGDLERDRVPVRLTLSLSPTLLAMLADPLLRARCLRHLDRLVELAEREERRTRPEPALHRLAGMYLARFYRARAAFLDEWQQDLISGFRAHQERGHLELIASAATHGVLPLLGVACASARAQIEVGVAEYHRFFGRPPEGFWLPECAYAPGLDAELARLGVRWFVLDTHGIAHATPRPVYGVYAPVVCESGVIAFGRDPESAKHVWSAGEGYPGDVAYRDFRRVTGASPFLDGLKYHRITGAGAHKEPYDPERARDVAAAHAAHFVDACLRHVDWLAGAMDRAPMLVCPFAAELFGRWWFEGPLWLELVFRHLATTPELEVVTPGDHLDRYPTLQLTTPSASSWGWKGHHETWLGDANDWLYPHLHATADRLRELCARYPSGEDRTRRALTQALRELLLAQASDWPFLMSRESTAAYAVRRSRDHLAQCQRLCDEVEQGVIDEFVLAALEEANNPFPALDYRVLL